MHITTNGVARIKDKVTGEIYEIDADELDWEVVGSSGRQMGPETEYQAAVNHPALGDLAWQLWEYPVGAENNQAQTLNGHELIENFDISLAHDPDSYEPDEEPEPPQPEEKRYFAEDDPVGIIGEVLKKVRDDDQVSYLTWWFNSYHVDPAHETPYNGLEGGYLYIHGGPFNAHDALWKEFSHLVSEEVIDRAVEEVEAEGILEWAPSHDHPDRIEDDVDWDERPDDDIKGTEDIIDRALRALEAGRQPSYGSPEELSIRVQIKDAFDRLEEELPPEKPVHGGFGHNNPPMDDRFTPADYVEIRRSIQLVRTELDKAEPNAVEVVKAAGFLKTLAHNVVKYSGIAAEEFAKGLGKSAGEEVGKGMGKMIKWGLFGLALIIVNAVAPIGTWLPVILPFL